MSAQSGNGEESVDRNVEVWKIKRLIKSLEMARGYLLLLCFFFFFLTEQFCFDTGWKKKFTFVKAAFNEK